ncbi:MAG: hypothetical protein WD226_14535 [Planctomycetota bacterium]
MRVALLILLFLTGLLGTSWAIRCLRAEPVEHGRRLKYEYLVEHADEYSVVLIGSSRVNHSLIPAIIEERLAARGHVHRVFNYGIGGMRSFEADEVFDKVLDLDMPELAVVVMEWPDWDGIPYGDEGAATERSVEWHTARRTLAVLVSLARADMPWPAAVRHALQHLRLALSRSVNFGAGSSWLQRRLGTVDFGDLPEVVLRDGFAATGEMRARSPEVEARRVAKTEQLLARKHFLDLGNALPVDLARYNRAALARQAAAAEARGVLLVWAVMPGEAYTPQAWRLAEESAELPLLLFNSPTRYPELYRSDTRWDPDHLNSKGARLFSTLFGDALAALLDRP